MNVNGYEIKPRADLRGANLTRADLREANLTRANLIGANLTGANLFGANLRRADLTGANLFWANLFGANLTGANLTEANLTWADLYRADLFGANLHRANLIRADLRGADLRDVDLTEANLTGAHLYGANLFRANLSPFQIPQTGTLEVWKRCSTGMVKLRIPAKAKRTASLIGRKCRAEYALVLSAPKNARDRHSLRIRYVKGEIVRPDAYDPDIRVECAPGIHFFLTREEAEAYS